MAFDYEQFFTAWVTYFRIKLSIWKTRKFYDLMKITKKNYFSLGIGNFYTVILCFKSWKINVYVISGHLTPNNVESKVSQPKIRNSDGNKPGNRIFCGLCLSFGAGNCHSTHPTMLLFLPLDMTFIFLVSDTLKSNSPRKLSFKKLFLTCAG